MTGFVRGALTVTAGLALLATSAMAGVPSPANSVVDDIMVGSVKGTALKGGGFGTAVLGVGYKVEVKDIGGLPIAGAVVTVNFSTASGDVGTSGAVLVNPYDVQIAGTTVDCPTKTLTKVADGSGIAIFTPIFGGAENTSSIEVRGNGVLLKTIIARGVDATGDGTISSADLSVLQQNVFGPGFPAGQESDFTLNGGISSDDLSILQGELFPAAPVRTPCV